MTMIDCEVHDNEAASGSAVLLVDSAVVTLQSCTFHHNTGHLIGGAIAVQTQSQVFARLTVEGSSFLDNVAYTDGGMVPNNMQHCLSSRVIIHHHCHHPSTINHHHPSSMCIDKPACDIKPGMVLQVQCISSVSWVASSTSQTRNSFETV